MASSPKEMEELRQRRIAALACGGEEKLAERRAKGQLSARDRLSRLFQEGSFQEIGMHVRHGGGSALLAGKAIPSDGVVTGTGFVNGEMVAAYAQDFTAMAGTLGKAHAG